jgi:hypothetical protein
LAVATDLASALFGQMLRVHCERASDAGALRLLSSLPSARAVSAMFEAGLHPSDDTHAARHLLEQLGVTGQEDPRHLSGGEARRRLRSQSLGASRGRSQAKVFIEAAINRLDLLILDDFEPLGHLFAPDGHRPRCPGTIAS